MTLSFLSQDVVPDAGAPGEGILRRADALARREFLFDLNDLAVFDLVGVDHRDGFLVVHPAVAGIARGDLRRFFAVEQIGTTAVAQIFPMALATLPDFGTGKPIVESPTTWMFFCFTRFIGDMIDFAPALVAADEIRFDGDGAGALRRNQIDHVVFHFVAGVRW